MAIITNRPSRPSSSEPTNALRARSDVTARLLRAGFGLAAVAVALQTVGHLTNALLLDYEVWNMDADQDGNTLSWASSVATFAVALAAFLLALLGAARRRRFFALAAVVAFFSVDDVVAIHEELASAVADGLNVSETFGRALWPLLYMPLLAFVAVTLWQLSERAAGVRRVIALALSLLGAAILLEAGSALWSEEGSRPLIDDVGVALEEGAELAGWILIASAVFAILFRTLAVARTESELSKPAAGGGYRL